MPKIYFTVTTDLTYDQRMMRICNSLADNGYDVVLVGRKLSHSVPLVAHSFKQKRLRCFFEKGKFFYFEYNIRLFLYLLFRKMDGLCAIDLDTILPCYALSRLRGIKRVYDAHEYFSQQKEVISRPRIYALWYWVEKTCLPRFKNGYTVSESIKEAFRVAYGVDYSVIRNVPILKDRLLEEKKQEPEKVILYQGAVNEARGLEFLIPAMKNIPAVLYIYGDGNFYNASRKLIQANNLQDKVFMKGKLLPHDLQKETAKATIAVNLVEPFGLNQTYSLANKFFDFIHSHVPQVTMDFPEYRKLNNEYQVALLIDELTIEKIALSINKLLLDTELYNSLKKNCREAALHLNWQEEEKKLLHFYKQIFG